MVMLLAKHWPASVLPVRVMFHPDIPSASGGPTPLGSEQVVFSSAGRWMAEMAFNIRPSITTRRPRDRILASRAMIAWMKGRSNGIYIGPFDESNSPSSIASDGAGPVGRIPHSDGALFSDGSGYRQRRTISYGLSNVSVEAMSMNISVANSGYRLEAGQYFGFGDNELYLIDSSSALGGGAFAVTFWPPMRSDHTTVEPINFDNPTCLMRASADASGSIAFEPFFSGQQTLNLVEEN